ncbi:MAG: class I SAM-dependent methyltransferase [bacterium]|nr:class I SAM-dependent methyltransferase [bacterium]
MKNKLKILEKGYINIYSKLTLQELRQIKYKTLYKKLNPSWDESMVFLSNKFRTIIASKNNWILDIGCGNGNYIIDENIDLVEKSVGVDLLPEFTQKNISVDKVVHCNLESLPLLDNSFDVVTSLWVLEHLENPDKVFNEVYRVLKPEGYFIFVTPNKNFIPLRFFGLLNLKKINHFINFYLFGRKEEDVFKTYYKANTIKDLNKLSRVRFKNINLFENFDPSYTAFNNLTFKITSSLSKFNWFKSHIVGVMQKT